jgi:hypothetical protein
MIFRSQIVHISDFDYFRFKKSAIAFEIIIDESKTACIVSQDTIRHLDFISRGKFKYATFSERLISDFYGLSLPKNHFIVEEFNRRTIQLLEFGVIDGLAKRYDFFYGAVGWKAEGEDPQVLSYDQLESWFQLWLGCLIVSLFGFFCEHFQKFCVRRWPSLNFRLTIKSCYANVMERIFKVRKIFRQTLKKRKFLSFKHLTKKFKTKPNKA